MNRCVLMEIAPTGAQGIPSYHVQSASFSWHPAVIAVPNSWPTHVAPGQIEKLSTDAIITPSFSYISIAFHSILPSLQFQIHGQPAALLVSEQQPARDTDTQVLRDLGTVLKGIFETGGVRVNGAVDEAVTRSREEGAREASLSALSELYA